MMTPSLLGGYPHHKPKLWLVGLQFSILHWTRQRQIIPGSHIKPGIHHRIFAGSKLKTWTGPHLKISDHCCCNVGVAFPHHIQTVSPLANGLNHDGAVLMGTSPEERTYPELSGEGGRARWWSSLWKWAAGGVKKRQSF